MAACDQILTGTPFLLIELGFGGALSQTPYSTAYQPNSQRTGVRVQLLNVQECVRRTSDALVRNE
jgi:hypothetical protein